MWHAVANSYMEPDSFRMHLNSLIQGLRNVTFVLQKQKRELRDFDTWYPKFRNEASANPLMRWSVDSRNRIVKESDLELHSEARIRWVADWLRKQERNFSFPPRMSSREMMAAIFSSAGNPQVGVVTISRRWVDKALPDYEILHATREVFISLSRLMKTAHEATGIDECTFGAREPQCVTASLSRDPLSCMELNPASLQEHLDLNSGSGIEEKHIPIQRNDKALSKAKRRYGETTFTPGDPIALAPQLMDHARRVIVREKKHINLAYLFRGEKVVDMSSPMYADQNAKYLTFHRLADRVETLRADGIVFLAEMWYVTDHKYDDEGAMIPPRDRGKDRMEALHVFAATRGGGRASLITPFSRNLLGKIILEPTIDDMDTADMEHLGPLTPIISRWRKMDDLGEH